MRAPAIRLATPDDAPRLLALLHAAYAGLEAHGVRFTVTQADAATVRERIRLHTSFLLEAPGPGGEPELRATVSVRFPWATGEGHRTAYPFIHWFAVHPGHKRQGLGRRLLDHAEHHFLRDTVKAPAVYLGTAVRHPWLTQLYAARGYEVFDRGVNRLGTELVWMRKVLLAGAYAALQAPEQPRAA